MKFTEVEPLKEEPKRDALKMTKKIGVQIERVITRCTVRGDELFVSKVFLEKKLIFLEPSVRRPNAAHYSPNETHYSVSRSMAQPQVDSDVHIPAFQDEHLNSYRR